MAEETAPDEPLAGEGKAKKGAKGNLVPAAVVAVGLVAGGLLMGRGGGGSSAEAAPAAAEEEHAEEEHAEKGEAEGEESLVLEPMTVNLAGGHFLKVAVALELPKGEKAEEWETKGKGAKAQDLVFKTFAGKEMATLTSIEGRQALLDELWEHVDDAYHGEVVSIYVTEFVMQ